MEPASDLVPLLKSVHDALPEGRVSVGWLYGKFGGHGPNLFLLFLGLLGAIPGADTPSGIAIGLLGLTMLARERPELPVKIASRRIASLPARYAIGRAIDVLNLAEHIFPTLHPCNTVFRRPVAPLLLILLGVAMLVPIPLSNIAPSLAVAMIGLALIEGSAHFVMASLAGAAAALGLTAWFVVLVIRGLGWFA